MLAVVVATVADVLFGDVPIAAAVEVVQIGRRDFRGSISRAPRDPVKSNRIPTREAEYAQLTAYVAHASHNDFWRKPAVQRTDLLKAISRLHYKCLQNGPATTSEDKALLLQAIDLIRRGRFTH